VAVKEENGAEGLILRGGRDVPFISEMSDKGVYLFHAHLARMAFVVKDDVLADPGEVCFFGAVGVMANSHSVAVLVEQFLFLARFADVEGIGGLMVDCHASMSFVT